MEVDNVQIPSLNSTDSDPQWTKRTLERAIATVTKATEHDMGGLYEEAVTLYDAALSDFNAVLCAEKSQVVRDCMLPKMDAYADRSLKLKQFLERCRSPGGLSADQADTSASSDSGVDTIDDLATAHNLSADSAHGDAEAEAEAETESEYATIDDHQRAALSEQGSHAQGDRRLREKRHQQLSRQRFLDACAEQVDHLLHIVRDESESAEIRDRARKRCNQILDFAEAYQRDFQPPTDAVDDAANTDAAASPPPPPPVQRTVSMASSVAAAEEPARRQLVRAEVLLSAEPAPAAQQLSAASRPPAAAAAASEPDGCPSPPDDGDAEFCRPLSFSIDSLRFADGEADSRLSDSTDYAIVRRSTPSPRRHLSQASLNKIEPDAEPLLRSSGPGALVLPPTPEPHGRRWWRRRRHAPKPEPEPLDHSLAEPGLFWIILGGICG